MDGLMFGDTLNESTVFFHTSDDQCQRYDGRQGRGTVLSQHQVSLYINSIGYTSSFYDRRTWCGDDVRDLNTDYPLTIISPHWPTVPGPGGPVHQARYQYNFEPITLPSDPLFIRGFNANDIPAIADRARCRWEAQIDQLSPPVTNNFEWVETTTGGRFYFTKDPLDYDPEYPLAAYTIFAETKTAFDSTDHWMLRDTCRCGYSLSWKNRSEIVFNNTAILHELKPHIRWTTDISICGDGPDCVDFYTIALHEMGHYLGLSHQYYNHRLIMSKAEIWPKQSEMTPPDAENIRRLYNPSRLNAPVDNSYDCSRFTDVQEYEHRMPGFRIVGELGDYSAVYILPSTGSVELDIYNAIGQKIISVFRGVQPVGEHIMYLPTQMLAAGVYLVRIKTDTGIETRTLAIIR